MACQMIRKTRIEEKKCNSLPPHMCCLKNNLEHVEINKYGDIQKLYLQSHELLKLRIYPYSLVDYYWQQT